VKLRVAYSWPKANCPLRVTFTVQLERGAIGMKQLVDPKLNAGPFVRLSWVTFRVVFPVLVTVIGNGGLTVFAAVLI
jgi:hypothetical protein